MTWVEIALGLLKLANLIMGWVTTEQAKQSGRDEEIARQTMEILRQTDMGKKIMEKIDAMSDSDLDNVIDSLGR